jgi:hypothetical protein
VVAVAQADWFCRGWCSGRLLEVLALPHQLLAHLLLALVVVAVVAVVHQVHMAQAVLQAAVVEQAVTKCVTMATAKRGLEAGWSVALDKVLFQ